MGLPPQSEYDHPEKGCALYALELSLEKLNNDKLCELHRVADDAGDAHMCIFSRADARAAGGERSRGERDGRHAPAHGSAGRRHGGRTLIKLYERDRSSSSSIVAPLSA